MLTLSPVVRLFAVAGPLELLRENAELRASNTRLTEQIEKLTEMVAKLTDRHQEGLFVAADKGTLFLDEIGEMPV